MTSYTTPLKTINEKTQGANCAHTRLALVEVCPSLSRHGGEALKSVFAKAEMCLAGIVAEQLVKTCCVLL